MGNMNLSLEIYDILERRLGRDDAMAVAKSIEESLSHVEERSKEIANQRKLEVKEELKSELRDTLATKADIAELAGATKADIAELAGATKEAIAEIKTDISKLEGKMNVRFVATIAVILFVNKDALMLMAHLFGLVK